MDRKSKGMRGPSIFNEVAQREWTCSKNGLRKELIDFTFNSMTKATEISKCLVNISDVKNLEDRESVLPRPQEFQSEKESIYIGGF